MGRGFSYHGESAARQVLEKHPDADADDVLLWAEAHLHALSSPV